VWRRIASLMVRLALALAAVAAPLAASLSPAGAQAPARVYLHPPSLSLAPAQVATLELRVENAQNLYGLEVHLAYDPHVLAVEDSDSAQPGIQVQLLDGFLRPGFVAQNSADNAAGRLDVAFTQVNPDPPVSGSGLLARIAVRALQPGVCAISFLPGSMLSGISEGEVHEVQAVFEGATIQVQAPQPPATPTPTPPAPTPTLPPTPTPVPTATIVEAPPTGITPEPTHTPTPPVAAATPAPLPTATPLPTFTATATNTPATAAVPSQPTTSEPEPSATTPVPLSGPVQTATATAPGEPQATFRAPTPSPTEPGELPMGTPTPAKEAMALVPPSATPDPAPPAALAQPEPLARNRFASPLVAGGVALLVIVVFSAVVLVPRERRRRAR